MIFRLTGGLGNQAMIYASARGIAAEYGLKPKFFWGRSTWDYALDKYNVKVELVNQPVHGPKYEEPDFAFNPNVFTASKGAYYCGYFQSPKYFEKCANEIRAELTLKEPVRQEVEKLAAELRVQNSVFVHVRRGDYTNPGTKEVHGVLPWEYYRDAQRYIKDRVADPKFFFFSDEPEWVREKFYTDFSLGQEVVIFGFTQDEDLYLMRNCQHGIGANSTFSWWANYLGEHPTRISIAPKKWFVNPEINTSDLIPLHWIRL